MKTKLLLFLLLLSSVSFAQLENANWCFGVNGRVDFNTTPNTTSTSSIGWGNPGSSTTGASVSDNNGQLLFYTDGINVWDRNDQPMPNGNNLYGYSDITSTQKVVIVPKPGHPNIYYIFTLGTIYYYAAGSTPVGRGGMHYSVVDMSSGTGEVVSGLKNIVIENHNGSPLDYPLDYNHTFDNPVFIGQKSRITTALHEDGSKIWLSMIADYFFNGIHTRYFYNFLVAADGIAGFPDGVSPRPTVSIPLGDANYTIYQPYIASMKVSPDGNFLCDVEDVVNLYNYNKQTGVINFNTTIYSSTPSNAHTTGYGVEFSPDSYLIYFTHNPFGVVQSGKTSKPIPSENAVCLFQYCIERKTLEVIHKYPLPQQTNATTPFPVMYPFGLQRGVDDKVYVCAYGDVQQFINWLGVIEQPNVIGIGCNFIPNGLQLFNNTSQNGTLPQWVQKRNCEIAVSPKGPIDYYTPLDFAVTRNFKLTSSYSTGNQWYYNDVPISGAINQELFLNYPSANTSGIYYTRVNGCISNNVTVNFLFYGYGWYGEDHFDRLGAKIHPVPSSNYYCYNSFNNPIKQFNMGSTATYAWNFFTTPVGANQNISLTPGSSNPNSHLAQVNIGGPVPSGISYVQGVADLNGAQKIIDYYIELSHPILMNTNQQVCANAGQHIKNYTVGDTYATFPGASGFDWESYNFGNGIIMNAGPHQGQSAVTIPGRSAPQQWVVKFTGPSTVVKNFYYNSNLAGCYREQYNVTLNNGCKDMTLTNLVLIYPNPCANQITISSENLLSEVEISGLMNTTLKKIKVSNNKSITIQVWDLKPGVYNCKITSNKGIENQKIIIKR